MWPVVTAAWKHTDRLRKYTTNKNILNRYTDRQEEKEDSA